MRRESEKSQSCRLATKPFVCVPLALAASSFRSARLDDRAPLGQGLLAHVEADQPRVDPADRGRRQGRHGVAAQKATSSTSSAQPVRTTSCTPCAAAAPRTIWASSPP